MLFGIQGNITGIQKRFTLLRKNDKRKITSAQKNLPLKKDYPIIAT